MPKDLHLKRVTPVARTPNAAPQGSGETRLLADASHSLRQPLNAMSLLLGVLSQHLEEPKLQPIVNEILQCLAVAKTQLKDLLEVADLDAGKIEPEITPVSLVPLMGDLVEEFAPAAARRGLSLRLVPSSCVVMSDRLLLERILRVFLRNALHFTKTGGVLLGARRNAGLLWMQVVDSGCGIADHQLPGIFDDFEQLTKADPDQGLGLGLPIARRLAALLGHEIAVQSQPGKGSIFAVGVEMFDVQGPSSLSR